MLTLNEKELKKIIPTNVLYLLSNVCPCCSYTLNKKSIQLCVKYWYKLYNDVALNDYTTHVSHRQCKACGSVVFKYKGKYVYGIASEIIELKHTRLSKLKQLKK